LGAKSAIPVAMSGYGVTLLRFTTS
jgi:hypothetical protein